MKLRSHALSSALMLMASTGASAACLPGSSPHTVDGETKCVLDASLVVIIDPVWLVAGGIALVLLLAVTVYLAAKVGRLANGLKSGGRIG